MRGERAVVAVIDDDQSVREALHGLLETVALDVELFVTVEDFLRAATRAHLIASFWMSGCPDQAVSTFKPNSRGPTFTHQSCSSPAMVISQRRYGP